MTATATLENEQRLVDANLANSYTTVTSTPREVSVAKAEALAVE